MRRLALLVGFLPALWITPLYAQTTVTPDGTSQHAWINSSNNQASFSIYNNSGMTTTYDLSCRRRDR